MTKYEFYKNVATQNLTDETIAYAANLVEKEDTAKASKAEENAAYEAQILDYLSSCEEPQRAAQIGEALDLTSSKVTALCKSLLAREAVTRESIVVNKRSVYAYSVVRS